MQNLVIPATSVHQFGDEPRILDTDLAEWLGFERPRAIRQLIERNFEELQNYGGLPHGVANSGRLGGRPAKTYYLNEGQALVLCALSRTDKAAKVRKALIDVFMDFRAGKIVPVKAHNRRPPSERGKGLGRCPFPFSIRQDRADSLAVLSLVMPLNDAIDLVRGRELTN